MNEVDPLVERLAKLLCQSYLTLDTWRDLGETRREYWRGKVRMFLRELSEPLPDGTRVVRTAADQTLPVCTNAASYAEKLAIAAMGKAVEDAGWLKCGPLVKEVGHDR